jgi:hypothetical protein
MAIISQHKSQLQSLVVEAKAVGTRVAGEKYVCLQGQACLQYLLVVHRQAMENIKAKLEQHRLKLVPDMLELGEQILETDPIEQGLLGELDQLRQQYEAAVDINRRVRNGVV